MKLRGFQRAHIGTVRLVEEHGELAEHRAGLGDRGDLRAAFDDRDRAAFANQKPPGFRALLGEHCLAGVITRKRKRGEPLSPNLGIVNKPHVSAPVGRVDHGS